MNKVGVVLSGCGHQDGSEIHEAVFTLHALEKADAEAIIMAPDMDQFHVINHLNGNEELSESRNILVESARIARGKVIDVASVSGHQLDALIFPGGTGMAKNIFDYSMAGINCTVISDVQRLVVEILEADKPLGAICIAPVMIAKVLEYLGRTGTVTGGFNVEINNDIKAMGINAVEVGAEEIVVDKENKIVTTPAYVDAKSMNESCTGIEKLVDKVLELI
ncbi:MAG: isoprenoid biosynthesis glyoxalase ElbB [Candidatus Neomarinimicrobiota bacterium]|nr:isoprenoid biosynthesis glyoxalase ElbB [Candidatus Neomarinimicrobiota bacterium]|tara:strand:+ start:150 stop:812 length:663 start_codon:yes stop_codon:yes gene_type:complete